MSEQRCEEFRELVSARADERLDGRESLRLEEHLHACSGCRAFESELRRFRGLLRVAAAFQPLKRPPPGFAAMVAARIERPPRALVVPFPATRVVRRPRAAWVGMAAAAAAATLFFAWSWQRLLPVGLPEQKTASALFAPAVELAAADEGSMENWMREHAMITRDSTLLGPAEEIEFARLHAAAVSEH